MSSSRSLIATGFGSTEMEIWQLVWKTVLVITAIVATWAVGLALLYYFAINDEEGELAQKHEWSVLQGLTSQNRDMPCPDMRLNPHALGTELDVVGLPSSEGCRWIILNPMSKPRVKQMPQGEVAITMAQLATLRQQPSLHAEVLAYLASRATR